MIDFIITVIIFLSALGILVVLHEWGHYIMAKLAGVWVEKFSIGFGPKIIGFQKNDTDYRIAPIPLGGYVKLYGQDPYEEADRDAAKAEEIQNDPRSFASKTYWQRMGIVLGGPVVNLLLCLMLLPLAFMAGKKELKVEKEAPVVIGVKAESVAEDLGLQIGDKILKFDGESVATWHDLLSVTGNYPGKKSTITFERNGETIQKTFELGTREVKKTEFGYLGIEPHLFLLDLPVLKIADEQGAAKLAGFQTGDRVLQINGIAVHHYSDMVDLIQVETPKAADNTLNVVIERDGKQVPLKLKPKFDEADKDLQWKIGVYLKDFPELYEKHSYPFVESLKLGWHENISLYEKLFEFLGGLFTGKISANRLGGPIQIAAEASSAASRGFGDFLYLLAFLSLQLGILNLLPIPVLDGGHALMMTCEAVIRRSLPHKVRLASLYGGMIFILGLMLYVTFNDLNKALGLSEIWQSLVG